MWGGPALAPAAASILPIVLYGTALSALSIAGCYVMLAMGRPRVVAWLNVAAAAAMIIAVWWLLPLYGIRGMALARFAYGPICLCVYVPLFLQLLSRSPSQSGCEARAALCEDTQ